MAWRVRKATVDDGARIAEIRVRGWQHAYRDLIPERLLADMRPEAGVQRWSDFAKAELPTKLFVAVTEDDQVMAYCLVGAARQDRDRHPDLPTGELWAIYAAPEAKGQGAGKALHEVAMNHLVEQGFRHAVLWVLEGNEGAMAFYRARGWYEDGLKDSFEWGGVQIKEVRYARQLVQQD